MRAMPRTSILDPRVLDRRLTTVLVLFVLRTGECESEEGDEEEEQDEEKDDEKGPGVRNVFQGTSGEKEHHFSGGGGGGGARSELLSGSEFFPPSVPLRFILVAPDRSISRQASIGGLHRSVTL